MMFYPYLGVLSCCFNSRSRNSIFDSYSSTVRASSTGPTGFGGVTVVGAARRPRSSAASRSAASRASLTAMS